MTQKVIAVAIFDFPGYFSSLSFNLSQYLWIPDPFYNKPTQHDRWHVMPKEAVIPEIMYYLQCIFTKEEGLSCEFKSLGVSLNQESNWM